MRGSNGYQRTAILVAFACGALLAASCGDDATSEPKRPHVDPGVRLVGLEPNPANGFAPLEVVYTVAVETLDRRAEVEVFIDFGDDTDTSKVTLTSLPEELQSDEVETSKELREVAFVHTYDEPGIYPVSTYARDITNSIAADANTAAVEVVSDPLTTDIEVKELPDLIGVSVAVDKTEIDLDEHFTITYQVLNDGSDVTRPFDLDIYLVRQPDMTTAQLADPQTWIQLTVLRSPDGRLNAGESISGSFEAQLCDPRVSAEDCDKLRAKVGTSTWYPAIYVDSPDATRPELNVLERDEDNNFRVGTPGLAIRAATDTADLSVANVIANPASTNVLREITLSFSVQNLGEIEAPTTRYAIFLSATDKQLDPLDQQLGTGVINTVAAGGSQNIANLAFTTPSEIRTPGEYWVLVKVDSDGALPELNEFNNILAANRAIEVLGVEPRTVDLTADGLTVSPPSTYVGGQVQVGFAARNIGGDDSGSYQCGVFLSSDVTLDTSSDTLLVMVGGENLAGGASETYSRVVFVPDFIGAGSYYVFAACDFLEHVIETDETNNVAGPSSSVQINLQPQVDYAVQNVVVTPTTLAEQDVLTFTAEICNLDYDFAGPVGVKAYLSADATVDVTDHEIAAVVTSSVSLGTDQCETVTLTGKVTCLPFVDSYTAGVVVDGTEFIIETDETNNVAVGADTITVTGGLGSICSCTEDLIEGSGNNDQATAYGVTLTGTDPKVASITDLSLCDSVDFYRIDLDRGDSLTATLTFDQSLGDLDLRLHDPNSPGTPFVSAGTAGVETIPHKVEASSGNVIYLEVFPKQGGERNYYTLDVSVVPSPTEPELFVRDINLISGTAPSVINPYDFEVEIENSGLTDATNFELTTYFSTNTVIDANDTIVGTVTIASLPSFATHVEQFTHTFDLTTPTGTYYFLAHVDATDAVVELDDTNNVTPSAAVNVDADCVPDAFEGINGNDVPGNAWEIRPTSTLQTWDNLSVCDLGRGDYYKVCVTSGDPLTHIGAVQGTYSSSTTGLQVAVYDLDNLLIRSDYSGYDALIGIPVPPYTCLTDSDCTGAETCERGACADVAGDHCVYAYVSFSTYSNAPTESYSLIVDAATTSNQANEPNNSLATASLYSPYPGFLAAGSGNVNAEDDSDWYYLDLKAGTTFDAVLNTADEDLRMYVYTTSTTSGTYTYPWEPTTVTLTTDRRVYFEVYKSYVSSLDPDNDTAYSIDLVGIGGLDLVPINFTTDVNLAQVNDAVLATWDLANQRLDDVTQGVEYRYLLSEDTVVDAGDWVLGSLTTAGPAAFTTVNLQDKVYLTVPTSVFGDYYLLIDVDPSNLVAEVNENNNIVSKLITIGHTCTPDMYEPNNTVASATPVDFIGTDTVLSAPNLSACKSDLDYYSIDVPAGATYTFVVGDMVPFAWGDVDIFLYASGVMVGRSDGLNTPSETIVYTNTSGVDQPVTLEVRPFRSTYSNVYSLTVTR